MRSISERNSASGEPLLRGRCGGRSVSSGAVLTRAAALPGARPRDYARS